MSYSYISRKSTSNPKSGCREVQDWCVHVLVCVLNVCVCVCVCVCVSFWYTVGQMAVSPGVDDVTQTLLQFLVAGEVEGVRRTRPHGCGIQPSYWSPDTLGGYDSPKSIHHIPVTGSRLRL
jgi:hypothetical protein